MPHKLGRKLALALLCSAALSGCVTTQEVPLAPNMVRLDTHAAGALFIGQASGQTLKRAAELTLQNGYTHFRLESPQTGQGEQLAGIYSSGNATAFATGYGATGFSSGFSTPLYARTADVAVTVVMFHANDPQAKNAFDAAAILKKYGS
jgi:hypothetical protein